MPYHQIRGTRLGASSHEPDRDDNLAARRIARYACSRGQHQFDLPFAADAEIPPTWDCRQHGTPSTLVDGPPPITQKQRPPRTHWDMLLERRSIPELEELLNERLEALRARRRRGRPR